MIVQFLVALIGLGIAIDYALLVVARWREERRAAERDERDGGARRDEARRLRGRLQRHDRRDLAARARRPAGAVSAQHRHRRPAHRAGQRRRGLTLLPVLLATIGPKLDWPRDRREAGPSRAWSAWARLIVRHRWAAASARRRAGRARRRRRPIQLGNPPADSLAKPGPPRAGLEHLQQSGIGAGPLTAFEVLVRGGDAGAVARKLARIDGVHSAAAPTDWRRDGTALVTVIPTADGSSAAGRATLDRIRATPLPGD